MRVKNGKQAASLPMPVYDQHSIRSTRLQFVLTEGRKLELKVNAVWRRTDCLLIGGWSSGPCAFQICMNSVMYEPESVVTPAKGPEGGFCFAPLLPVEPEVRTDGLFLCVRAQQALFERAFPLNVDDPGTWGNTAESVAPVLARMAGRQRMFSSEWRLTLAGLKGSRLPCPGAAGAVDFVFHTAWTGQAIVAGWFSAVKDVQVWLEHDNGQTWALDGAWRYYRKDVQEAVGSRYSPDCDQAFILVLDGVPPDGSLYLNAVPTDGNAAAVYALGSTSIESCGLDVLSLAGKAFLPTIPPDRFVEAATRVFEPVLSACLERRAEAWEALPRVCECVGNVPASPLLSIIVPLYGRSDHVDYQLAAFQADAWLMEHAELVYVVDDPGLASDFSKRASSLHALYGMPFRRVWGHANRGFSGANNLGAGLATADALLFLNSDVFPVGAGWAARLLETLALPGVGAVGARLLRVDGSLQHAGMSFRHMDELGVWINEHPCAGCAPSLDPHGEAVGVPAVTGACLLVRKGDFEAVGGWDCGYLVGDFEDSDLCMKLRRRGLEIVYEPRVCLTHLERQSYSAMGDGEFRQRVTLFNAARHQRRWAAELAEQGGQIGDGEGAA